MSGGSWSGPWGRASGGWSGGWRGGYEPANRGGKGSKGGRNCGKGKGKGSKGGGDGWLISGALLSSLLGETAGSGGPPPSASDWIDAPTEQAAAASSPTKDEAKNETTKGEPAEPTELPSRADSFLVSAGVSKWEICVQLEPPLGETLVERLACIEFTKESLRAQFTNAELASMFELG